MDEAEAKFGENGIEKRNSVDDPWVRTIVRTVPNRRASRGVARLANPITRLLMPPKIGPVTSFASPYLRKAQPGIRGITIPAPRAITIPYAAYRKTMPRLFLGRMWNPDCWPISCRDSETLR